MEGTLRRREQGGRCGGEEEGTARTYGRLGVGMRPLTFVDQGLGGGGWRSRYEDLLANFVESLHANSVEEVEETLDASSVEDVAETLDANSVEHVEETQGEAAKKEEGWPFHSKPSWGAWCPPMAPCVVVRSTSLAAG